MRHLAALADRAGDLFALPPGNIDRSWSAGRLGAALGATLYTPATTRDLPGRLDQLASEGVVSSIICLEDSIADDDVEHATQNVVAALKRLDAAPVGGPLRFLRLRSPEGVAPLFDAVGDAWRALDGVVIPKFGATTAVAWLAALDAHVPDLPFMPVLEDASVLDQGQRVETLRMIRSELDARRERVLVVRTGTTDLSGLLGLRRSADQTIYDLAAVVDCFVSILGMFGTAGAYIVSGGVWEYFQHGKALWKPQLRESVFPSDARSVRTTLIATGVEQLVRETLLDLANGFLGKSVIHPRHVGIVDACHVVSAEQHRDALDVLGRSGGGARSSPDANKMNEAGPHRSWAERTIRRAHDFGVLRDGCGLADLLVEVGS